MNISRRVAANRNNAKRSTGPKSAAGKRRGAENALRHGLTVPVALLPDFGPTTTKLTAFIAGPKATAERLDLARRIAEAKVDLARIRQARVKLMEPPEKLAIWATTGLRPGFKLSPFEVHRTLEQLVSEAAASQQLT